MRPSSGSHWATLTQMDDSLTEERVVIGDDDSDRLRRHSHARVRGVVSAVAPLIAVQTRDDPEIRYRAVERVVGIDELDDFITSAITELGPGDGSPFAVFHGRVNETTRSRVEVGVPDANGDRVVEGGRVASAVGPADADYDAIHVVYDAISGFITEHGLVERPPTREIYHDDGIEVVWPIR
jgi:hypothetical protein